MIKDLDVSRLVPVLVLGLASCLTTASPSGSGGSSGAAHETDESQEPTSATGSIEPPASTGHAFLDDPDGGGVSIKCSVWNQDCPPGEKCMPWANDGGNAWNATKCSPIAPDPAQPGEPCTAVDSAVSGIDDCAVASMCWEVDPDTLTGVCRAFCIGSEANPICENPDEVCPLSSDGVLILCRPTCDPLMQDCPVGQSCIGVGQEFLCAPDRSGDGGMFGDTCEYLNACDPGLECLYGDAVPGCGPLSSCCSWYCALDDADPPCVAGQACVPWFDEHQAPPGWENVGICSLAE